MVKKILVVAISSIAMVLFSSLATFAEAPKSIKIGGAVSLTGKFASGGHESKFGYGTAVADINKSGGVFVKEFNKKIPLELILEDDESDPTKTVARLEKLYAVDKVAVYLGGYGSSVNAASAGIAEKNKVPILSVSFHLITPHQQGYRYLFSPFVKTDEVIESTFKTIATIPESERPTKVAIFAEKTDGGEEFLQYTPDLAKKYGSTVVTSMSYAPGTKDYSSLIIAAKSAGADIVISFPTPPDGVSLMRQIKELSYNPKFILFTRAAGAPLWPKNLGKDGDYVCYVSNWDHNFKYPGCEELTATFKEANNNKLPTVTVGVTYSCIQIISSAIERAGTLNSEKIRDAIAATDIITVQGPVKFRPDGVGVTPCAIMQWQRGISEIVFHEKFVTAPLMLFPKWSEPK